MRQVPSKSTFLIIGRGRVARHFQNYFHLLGLPFKTWDRDSANSPAEAAQGCTHVLLLIRDDAIEPFIRSHPELMVYRLIHFSGSLVTNLAYGAHPLMTFNEGLYELDIYRHIPFVVEKGAGSFEELLPGLPNPNWEIDPAQKPLYHALCVLGGNFSVILWGKVFSEFEKQLHLPREIVYPYLKQISSNLQDPTVPALTGPLARRDKGTISKNIEALNGDAFAAVYRAMVGAIAPGLLPGQKENES